MLMRLLSSMSGDKQLIEAYNNKRDLYATVASKIYGNSYWDNMEVHEDGTPNPEGKVRRGNCKVLVLAILYGMGADSLSVSLKCTKEKAQKFIDDFFAGYPTVHKFIEESNAFARKNGYVDGIMGRRRRLPDILLPRYSVSRKGTSELFNPILGTDKISEKREDSVVKKYKDKVAKSKGWREVKEITEEAKKEGVIISNNGGFISRAERQAVNSKIQGGAATITKLAMLNIDRDEELNRLGFRTLICVHDEVIGECPSENASRVAERLQEVMVDSAKDVCSVRMKCDLYKVYRWYADDFSNTVKEMYDKAIEKGTNSVSAKNEILHKYDFVSSSVLDDMMLGNFDVEKREDI